VAEAETLLPGNHVPDGTPLAYPTNPPSSGPHYAEWANFQEFDTPVPDGNWVHSMEHGAVVLLYKCTSETCASVVSALRAIRDALPADPGCDPSTRVRIVITPRPTLDVPIAAAAWGFTYRAGCVDPASLTAFVTEHYAHAPEDFCAPGITTF
jgi:hypothetical protein